MSATIIYHNPNCSKCRAALTLLQDKGIHADVIDYLVSTPDRHQIMTIINSGVAIEDLIRTHEDAWQALNINLHTASQDDLITAIIQHPNIMQRPIVLHQGLAFIARPPEKLLEIL